MIPFQFDAEAATLRLDRETFAALVAYAAEPTGGAPHLAELGEAGAYRDGRFHPALEEGLDAVPNPVWRLEARVAGAQGREDHGDGWVSGDAAGFLLPGREGLCDFVVVHLASCRSSWPGSSGSVRVLAPPPLGGWSLGPGCSTS